MTRRSANGWAAAGARFLPSGLLGISFCLATLYRSGGVAVWMKTHESEYDRPEGVSECRWVVTSMFCAEASDYE